MNTTTTTNTTTSTDPRPPISDEVLNEVHRQLLDRMNATLHDMAVEDGRDPTVEIPPALLLFDSDGHYVSMVHLSEFMRDDDPRPIGARKDALAEVIRTLRAAGAPLIAYVSEAWVRQLPKDIAEREPSLSDGSSMEDDPRYRVDGMSFNYTRPDMPPRLIVHTVGVRDGVRVIGETLFDSAAHVADGSTMGGRFAIGAEDRSNLQ